MYQARLSAAEEHRIRAAKVIDISKTAQSVRKATVDMKAFTEKNIVNDDSVKAYHHLSSEIRKGEKAFAKLYGAENRKIANETFLTPAKIEKEIIMFEVSRFILQQKIEQLIKEKKVNEARSEFLKLGRMEKRSIEIKEKGNELYPGRYPSLEIIDQMLKERNEQLLDQMYIRLATPKNLRVEGTMIKWDVVPIAERYVVEFFKNGNPIMGLSSAVNPSTGALYMEPDIGGYIENGTFSMRIKAVGDLVTYVDSRWSEEIIFKVDYISSTNSYYTIVNYADYSESKINRPAVMVSLFDHSGNRINRIKSNIVDVKGKNGEFIRDYRLRSEFSETFELYTLHVIVPLLEGSSISDISSVWFGDTEIKTLK